MATCPEHGPASKNVDMSTHSLTGQRMSSVVSPMKDLKNQPNDDAHRAIKGMKYSPEGWKSGIQSAMRQRVG